MGRPTDLWFQTAGALCLAPHIWTTYRSDDTCSFKAGKNRFSACFALRCYLWEAAGSPWKFVQVGARGSPRMSLVPLAMFWGLGSTSLHRFAHKKKSLSSQEAIEPAPVKHARTARSNVKKVDVFRLLHRIAEGVGGEVGCTRSACCAPCSIPPPHPVMFPESYLRSSLLRCVRIWLRRIVHSWRYPVSSNYVARPSVPDPRTSSVNMLLAFK